MLTDADESPVLPENILVKAEKAAGAIVPQKSRKIYEKEYASFEEWLKENKIGEWPDGWSVIFVFLFKIFDISLVVRYDKSSYRYKSLCNAW